MVAASSLDTWAVALHTSRWGPVDGRRVLLIHGVQSSGGTWWRIADALAAAGHHVVAPDLRGHGRSPGAVRYRLEDFTADLLALGERWDLVIGHSLGATVAAHALATAPDLAPSALLLDPVLELPEDDFDAIVAGQLAELDADPATIQAANPGWHAEDCRLKALAAAACSPYVNEAVLRDNRPWRYGHLLAALTTPTLILGGDPEAGAMFDPALATASVQYQRVAGAGHSIHRDRPHRVIEAARRCL
jgi:pimeloyl-ACP methyl ester carboxylesterase